VLVVGVDPGLASCGVVVARAAPGSTPADLDVLAADVLTTSPGTGGPRGRGRGRGRAAWVRVRRGDDTMRRAMRLAAALSRTVEAHGTPAVLCHESFAMPSAPTMLQLGHVLGVVAALAEKWGATVCSRGPRELKAAMTGDDQADKAAMIEAVRALRGPLPLPARIPPSSRDHAYDAFAAVAACWALPAFARAREEDG